MEFLEGFPRGGCPTFVSAGSVAGAVSSDGSVIGGVYVSASSPIVAFVSDEELGGRDLHAALSELGVDLEGWRLEQVSDISDDGTTLVGFGSSPSGERVAFGAVLPRTRTDIEIDIVPRDDIDTIDLQRRSFRLAILGSPTLEPRDIDRDSLRIGPGEAGFSRGLRSRGFRDVNGDGYRDLVGRVRIDEAGVAMGDTELCIEGVAGGAPFIACDAIEVVFGGTR